MVARIQDAIANGRALPTAEQNFGHWAAADVDNMPCNYDRAKARSSPTRCVPVTTTERRDALLDLVLLRCPLEDAIEAIKRFPWDSDVEVVTLTREDAVRVLRTFETGTLSASDCAAWANAIEGRDDIGLEENADEALKDFLFEVGTPEISRQLTRSTAEEWRRRLG